MSFFRKKHTYIKCSLNYILYIKLFQTFKFVTSDIECHFCFDVDFNVSHLNLKACFDSSPSVLGLSLPPVLVSINQEAELRAEL